ncbi:MAG: DUF192 domain-containing protein [Deltaproteobacteria bacterium]|nr:DUF192 domain-containing protein [Deltaproteobacteria bacterium]
MLRRAATPLLVAVAVGTTLLASCRSEARGQVILEPKAGEPVPVAIELATTPDARQLGLMYRDELAPGTGMLFVFPDLAPRSFWMLNTKIPLDILFIADDGRIVNIHERTKPYSPQSLPSREPVRFVLEVPAGFTDAHGVDAGDHVSLGSLASTRAR